MSATNCGFILFTVILAENILLPYLGKLSKLGVVPGGGGGVATLDICFAPNTKILVLCT